MAKNKTNSVAYALHRFELGWLDEALNLLEGIRTSTSSKKEQERASLELGKLYLILDQAAKAIPLLESVDHQDPQVYFRLGLAYRKLNQWTRAINALEKADQLIPNDPKILSNLGWVYYKNGQKEKGREFVIRSLRLNHMSVHTLVDLARMYASEKRIHYAAACAQRALELDLTNTLAPDTAKMLISYKNESKKHPPRPPKTKNPFEWQDYYSKIYEPGDELRAALEVFNPTTEKDLQQLSDKLEKLWNTSLRPELGERTPLEVINKKIKSSQVDQLQPPRFMSINSDKAEANVLRKNMVTYLTHLQREKYSATSSLGNLPLKAMYAINELLINPETLETQIGDQVFKPKSSEDVWTFKFLNVLATVADLAVFEPGRRIKITGKGVGFLESTPNRQLWLLFQTWWRQINWLYAYHLLSFTEEVMDFLPNMTKDFFGGISPGKWINIKDFIDLFIETGSLMDFAETKNEYLINGAIEKMIFRVLAEFDCLEIKTKPVKIGNLAYDDLYEFRVTDFGHELLASL